MVSTFNIILIIIYFAIVLYIGIKARKKEDDEGFLLANRNVGVFALTATLVASMIGGNSIVSTMAFVYDYGISVIWVAVGTLAGFLILALLAKKIKNLSDENRFYTLPDFLHKKYGKTVSIPTALIIFIIYLGYLLIQFIAGGIVLSAITGWPYYACVLLMGIVVIIYITAAGFKAVVRTDIFQYFILFLLVILGFVLFQRSGTIDPVNLNFFAAGPANITGFLLYGIIICIIGAEIWQRIYAGKDVRTVKKSLIWTGILTAFMLFIIILMGMFVQSRFPNIVPETALAIGFSQLLPSYLVGIGLVILFAAIMSSLDTFLFLLSTSVSKDFFAKFERFSKHDFVKHTRLFAVVIGIVGIILALLLTSIVSILIAVAGIYFTLFPAIIFSFKYQLKRKSVLLSIIGGIIASILASIFMGLSVESAVMSFPVSLILLGIGQLVFRKKDL